MRCAKMRVGFLLLTIVFLTVFAICPGVAQAAVTTTGDVFPPEAIWNSGMIIMVGGGSPMMPGNGTLLIDGGSTLTLGGCIFGGMPMCTGAGTVTDNATWNLNNAGVLIGVAGDGSLYISNGGTVNSAYNSCVSSTTGMAKGTLIVDGSTSLFQEAGDLTVYNQTIPLTMQSVVKLTNGGAVSVGGRTFLDKTALGGSVVQFDTGGGTLTTKSLYASSSALTGTGSGYVVARGWVGDDNLIFDGLDANYGLNQTIAYTSSGRNVSLNLNLSDSTNVGDLGTGYWCNTGSLVIRNGIAVHSALGYLGYNTGSAGTATVTGANSKWTTNGAMTVGNLGDGTLDIQSGGAVSNTYGYIGFESGSNGAVTVDGSGGASTWNNSGRLYVGHTGNGTLDVTNGGYVESSGCYMAHETSTTASVTVSGAGSQWSNDGDLHIGYHGAGTVTIGSGGLVANSGNVYSADYGTAGVLNFAGGTLATQGLYAAAASVIGTGDIQAKGIVTDAAITFDSQQQSFTMGSVSVDLDVSGASGVADLGVGYATSSGNLLKVRNGVTVNSASGYLGYKSGSLGTAIVDNNGTWAASGPMFVGNDGTGVLTVVNAGTVSSSAGYIAIHTGSAGTATVDGSGGASTWTNSGSLYVGNQGNGTLIVTNGGRVNSADGCIGAEYMGKATVQQNSMWNNSGNLKVGGDTSDGFGTLEIFSGGTVSNAAGYVAYSVNAAGSAVVDGNGSTWINSGGIILCNNNNSQATLDVRNGGRVVTNAVTVGKGAYTNSVLTFDGGTIQAYDADNPTWISAGSGTAAVRIQAGGAAFDTAGQSMGIDLILQHGSVTTDGGITKLGEGTLMLSGANTYNGVTTVVAGVLKLDGSAQNPVFNVGGADIQGGKLVFTHSGGTATGGQIWAILDNGFDVDFASGQIFSSTAQANGKALGWSDDGSEVTVMYTLFGDSNLDGSVNGTDLNAVLSYYNQSDEVWANGDFNYDGSVNGTDLNTVLSNYNQSLASSTAAVPEPSTWLLIVLGLAGLLAWRKRN